MELASDDNVENAVEGSIVASTLTSRITKKSPVLFMAQYRSGSSFGATIFNKHKDAFYMYEPLIAVESVLPNQMHYDLDIIENLLYNCSVLNYTKFSENYKKDYNLQSMPKPGQNCRTNSMCFWYSAFKNRFPAN